MWGAHLRVADAGERALPENPSLLPNQIEQPHALNSYRSTHIRNLGAFETTARPLARDDDAPSHSGERDYERVGTGTPSSGVDQSGMVTKDGGHGVLNVVIHRHEETILLLGPGESVVILLFQLVLDLLGCPEITGLNERFQVVPKAGKRLKGIVSPPAIEDGACVDAEPHPTITGTSPWIP